MIPLFFKICIFISIVFVVSVKTSSVRLCTGCLSTNNNDITEKCCRETKNHVWNINSNTYANMCFVKVKTENDFENCCKNNDCKE